MDFEMNSEMVNGDGEKALRREMADLMALRLDGVASAEQVQRHDELLASASPDQA